MLRSGMLALDGVVDGETCYLVPPRQVSRITTDDITGPVKPVPTEGHAATFKARVHDQFALGRKALHVQDLQVVNGSDHLNRVCGLCRNQGWVRWGDASVHATSMARAGRYARPPKRPACRADEGLVSHNRLSAVMVPSFLACLHAGSMRVVSRWSPASSPATTDVFPLRDMGD